VTLEHKKMIKPYLYKYGEGSCQHSFAAMFCMSGKYGDSVCEKDGWLFIHRAGISSKSERAYLFPMGDISQESRLKVAIEAIIEDAHHHGAAVRFETLTASAKDTVVKLFPDRFSVTPLRDYAEYIYTYDKLANLPGHKLQDKRYDIRTFYRSFCSRTRIEKIEEKHLDEIRSFQKMWLDNRLNGVEDVQLEHENIAIQLGLSNFAQLELSGIVIYIDNVMCGYAYGAPLAENSYDVIIEKGDRRIADIYRVLNRDLVRLCCKEYQYINREEDVGVEGLRYAKLSYQPDVLLEKYLLREVRNE
ncbi:MAG: phosphatidylglycerol lysyltransferase domain-containing protein, partial [Petrimonas sp.]|nr:phosphatidylglycerol lysyltransferase domain-containing protein [Petrimonas sp.]